MPPSGSTSMKCVEVFSEQTADTGEGPVWSAREEALYWVDIGERRLYRQLLADSRPRMWCLPDYPGCVAELVPGSVAIAMGAGIHRIDLATGRAELLHSVPLLKPGVRFNDGKVDPEGRFWAGTMQNNFGSAGEALPVELFDGCLYRVDSRGATVVETDVGISNTLAWSPDAKCFYFGDSLRGWIWVYDFDRPSGEARNRRPFFQAPDCGVPDGSAMDVDGCLWNVRWDGSAILRITPDGRLDRLVELPVPRPTSCAFGGHGLRTLFVTSATNGLDAAARSKFPLSGSVLAIHALGQGLQVPRFNIKVDREG